MISVTPAAVTELKRLMTLEDQPGAFLRIGVTSGGCSGLSYVMKFDTQRSELDRQFDFDGLEVRVDLKALLHLAGTSIDYKGGLQGGFAFSNPKAKRSCGCGSSFSN
ncbi:iron-sulfur cluster assembly accessory protein [candidate division GN15 bacterium]|uniref:Iron-sulfur cluster assembly accessory protein n=1 Tax=candidate division GN15 bacterium TaxID=2072418 RepID=A0A855WX55_9BACT|nr:MAG: iron-sulfur cluster assembly accessory protein [candidate division GN15 bacterium]